MAMAKLLKIKATIAKPLPSFFRCFVLFNPMIEKKKALIVQITIPKIKNKEP